MRNREKKHSYQCWVDNLNVFSLTRLVILRCSYEYEQVRYLKESKAAGILIKKLKLTNILSFSPVCHNDSDISSREEREVYHDSYSEQSDLAIDAARSFLTEKTLMKNLGSRYNLPKVDLFLKQQIASESLQFLIINNFIKLFCAKNAEIKHSKHIVIIKSNIWLKFLQSRKKDFIWKICAYPDLKKIIEPFFVLIKALFEIVANSFLILSGKKIKNILGAAPKIGVLHAHGADLEKKADYFWFQNSAIDPQRIIVYFKYHCWPPKEVSTRLIESYGIQWVGLLPWKLFGPKALSCAPEFYKLPHSLYIRKSIRAFLETIKLFRYCLLKQSKVVFWQWQNLANLFNRTALYESFFTVYNIKIHHGVYEAGADAVAVNLGAELAGAVDICHHWSNFDVPVITSAKSNDIHFSWGRYYEKYYFDKKYYNFKYLVCIGYPYDYLFRKCRKKAQGYRQRLMGNGARFIVCFFEQVYSWPKASEDNKNIYQALLNKVIEDPSFGLILKPKKIKHLLDRPYLRCLKPLAQKAKGTGRCLFLEGTVFSNEAAQASDLAIGYGIYSTPALEAALSGVPAITCDLQNFSKHPFYSKGANSTVFNDLKLMMRGIEQFRNENSNPDKFGDYSFFLNDIDPFRDRRASERAGYLIKCLLDEFDKGAGRIEAIEKAVKNYRIQWGNDKVVDFAKKKLKRGEECGF